VPGITQKCAERLDCGCRASD